MSFNPLHLLSLSLLRSSIPKQWAYSEWESLELGHLHGFLAFGYDCVSQACIFHIDNLELAILSGSPGSFSGELVIRNYNLKKKKEGQRCSTLLKRMNSGARHSNHRMTTHLAGQINYIRKEIIIVHLLHEMLIQMKVSQHR